MKSKTRTGTAKKFVQTPAQKLRIAYLTMHRIVDACFQKRGVTADQYVLLRTLSEEEGINQKELSLRLSSDQNTVTAMIRLLEGRKTIRREIPEHDRRARKVYITARGRKLLNALLGDTAILSRTMDSFLPPAEMEKFLDALDRIPQAMAEAGARFIRNPPGDK
jgi:DNA-binding MarR family transcriptional regulator